MANDKLAEIMEGLSINNDDTSTAKAPARKAASKAEDANWSPAEREARKNKVHKYKPGETRTIVIQKDKTLGGDRPVVVGYNGTLFSIPRGIPIVVPAPVMEILFNAEETLVEWDDKGNALTYRQAASYPTSARG